jgi:hypothetical protein
MIARRRPPLPFYISQDVGTSRRQLEDEIYVGTLARQLKCNLHRAISTALYVNKLTLAP